MPKTRSPGDGGLYYLKSKNLWRGVVELESIDGKRRQKMVTSKTQRECKRKLDALKDEIKANKGKPLDRGFSMQTWSDKWLVDYARKVVDPKTLSTYRSLTKNWIVPVIGRKKVVDLLPSDVHKVLNGIRDAGRSLSTSKQTYIVMSQMLEEARREGICASNVVADVPRPGKRGSTSKGAQPVRRDALELDAVMGLLRAAKGMKNGSMWWFKIFTGQRQGEILGATLDGLELDIEAWGEPGFYAVNWKLEELTSEHGCGDQVDEKWPCGKVRGGSCSDRKFIVPQDFEKRHLTGRLHLTRPKSQTGKRVAIVAELADEIRRHLIFMRDTPNPYGLIWRRDDGSPILPKEDADGWRSLLLAAGLINADQAKPGGTPITGHWARHNAITDLSEAGIDMHLIGEMVGQSSERVTQAYRHARDQEKLRAASMLADRYLLPAES